MAGVLKVRDTDGTLRTITAVKVRDTDGTLRTLTFIKVRDTDGTLREVFTSGGGGSSNPSYITPGYTYEEGTVSHRSTTFTAASSGTSPSSYTWGILSGPGLVASGGSSATCTITAFASVYEPTAYVEVYCDMVISGTTYRATATFEYSYTGGGGFA